MHLHTYLVNTKVNYYIYSSILANTKSLITNTNLEILTKED